MKERNFIQKSDKTSETLILYATLDDKNRTIQALKQRLLNQQLQLAYYLHKNIINNDVLKFSSQCVPQLTEENLQLSLAMYKFVEANDKNKLNTLHNKLKEYDDKVTDLLSKQEEYVKNNQIEDKSLELFEKEKEFKNADRACRMANLDLYTKIMQATIQVKKELEDLKQYSERVVQLESERNLLIDYVFSLPSEHRLTGLNLIGNLKKDNQDSSTMSSTYTSTVTLEEQSTKKYLGYELNKVVSTMESKTVSLVSLAQEQRTLFSEEVEKLKTENKKLSELLIKTEINPEKVLALEEKCNNIENDLEDVRRGLETEVTDKDREIERLAGQLRQANDQSSQLRDQILSLRTSIEDVVKENELLHETVGELIKKPDEKCSEADLQEIVRAQREQIKNLMLIICNLNDTCDNVLNMQKDTEIDDNIQVDSGMVSSYKTEDMLQESQDYVLEDLQHEYQRCTTSEDVQDLPKSNPSTYREPSSNLPTRSIHRRHLAFPEPLTKTSLHVESCDPDGKKETMKAILESTSLIDGFLEMGNASKLKLCLKCSSLQKTPLIYHNSKSVVTLHNTEKMTPSIDRMDEMGFNKELHNLKEMNEKLKSPCKKKSIINNIKNMYTDFFGAKVDTA